AVASSAGSVSAKWRSSPTRCWCTVPTAAPALACAVAATISSSGCPAMRRSSSPPAYPLAPATATRTPMGLPPMDHYAVDRINIQTIAATRLGHCPALATDGSDEGGLDTPHARGIENVESLSP